MGMAVISRDNFLAIVGSNSRYCLMTTWLMRVLAALVLFLLACVLPGVYGAIHNQISYSISPEYFTKYKFEQFQIAAALPPRFGAAVVGWKASWFMGLLIGVFLLPAGMVLLPGVRRYFLSMLVVMAVVLATTIVVAAGGLVLATWTLDASNCGEFSRYGNAIDNDLAFARAGALHNASYLGGGLGILTGAITIYIMAIRSLAPAAKDL